VAFVTGVVTRFLGTQMGAGVNMWTAYRNLKIVGLTAPYTAFADSWAKLYKQRAFSEALRTTWFTGAIPRGLVSERVLKQPYKYMYTYTVGYRDLVTGDYRTEATSLYSNQWMTREEASERIISKVMVSEDESGVTKHETPTVMLRLAEHNVAMEW